MQTSERCVIVVNCYSFSEYNITKHFWTEKSQNMLNISSKQSMCPSPLNMQKFAL
jgi:hypothetical protein